MFRKLASFIMPYFTSFFVLNPTLLPIILGDTIICSGDKAKNHESEEILRETKVAWQEMKEK